MKRLLLPSYLVFFLLCLAQVASAGEDFDLWRGRYRVSAETAELPGGERMGVAGVHYLVDVAPRLNAGVGAYGAMTGQRGGFLVGGIETGFEYPVAGALRLDAGIFVGGGGGKSALVGGGLVVRSHAGLLYDAGTFRVGLHYVDLDFPNGVIKSEHAALTLDIPFTALRLRSGSAARPSEILAAAAGETGREPGFVRDFLGPRYRVYRPFSGVRNTDAITPTERFSLIGFEYGRYLTDHGYAFMETSGAMGGNADGYAEVFFGGGYAYPLFSPAGRSGAGALVLDGRLSIGSGGGGRIDTGGGALSKAEAGLQYRLTDQSLVGVSGGVVDAFKNGFRATVLGVNISYSLDFISFENGKPVAEPARDGLLVRDWRFRISNQVYRTEDERMRANRSDRLVSLLGVKVDVDVSSNLYLSGQALGAYSGGAGGYAAGLIGPGVRSARLFDTGARVFFEALVGASGGGGIDVGGGMIVQPTVGMSYDLGDRLSIEASCGKVKALHGQLDTTVYDVGLVYRFSTMNR